MDAKEFKERLLKSLSSLTDDDIKRIREEYNSEGDYGIDESGNSYWIAPETSMM